MKPLQQRATYSNFLCCKLACKCTELFGAVAWAATSAGTCGVGYSNVYDQGGFLLSKPLRWRNRPVPCTSDGSGSTVPDFRISGYDGYVGFLYQILFYIIIYYIHILKWHALKLWSLGNRIGEPYWLHDVIRFSTPEPSNAGGLHERGTLLDARCSRSSRSPLPWTASIFGHHIPKPGHESGH